MGNLTAVFCCTCPAQLNLDRDEFQVSRNEDGSSGTCCACPAHLDMDTDELRVPGNKTSGSNTTSTNLPKLLALDAGCIACRKTDRPPAAELAEAAKSELPQLSPVEKDEERWLECAFVLEDEACTAAPHQDEKSSETTRCLSDDFAEELQPLKSCSQERPLFKADWWQAADLTAWACGSNALASPALLRCARVVKHSASLGSFDATAPWQPGHCEALHAELGAQQPSLGYLAVWLKLNAASLVLISAVPKNVAVELGCRRNLAKDLKLILNPVQVPVPFPAKGPADADTIASFFGGKATHQSVSQTSGGAKVACVQIDLYSNWMLRMALKQIGFRLGNVLELILVDWPGRQVISALRLAVTEDFLQLVK
eukprot:TRINITY_DN2823_c0_g1_i4.p1 TRINITY_DN2823_c0_g1~~TRINITY_DN2823_c0_g1_i4.p1  ORF type:complete len:370 (+),score=92.45 TRINITY_DN2823_c0_g1_i4:204-1313(+)